ncbi:hypothetical protein JZO76_11230 [Enterococcus sp. MJM12]|uniref:Uncharacterized protein n=1 Tax=Candidatus Enterococcus myersii TaxID=2815322 RepID=A0ABS3HBV8_9ENTE|nr:MULTISPECIES: hypothetical protein [Enterococcus]MBO0450093.1 hypothetical protein [Enterococcus sp. MJM12]MCD1024222.1 hypothetical protein [Enterococcus sp. SMC-9]MDT2739344.1 hypothetical protein [Enterococcus canintestini]WHA09788.1 hypothetical protein P3T75_02810 [Enterococcus montenegrensis]
MKKEEVCINAIYEADVIGYEERKTVKVISILERTVTVEVLDCGLVALAKIATMEAALTA